MRYLFYLNDPLVFLVLPIKSNKIHGKQFLFYNHKKLSHDSGEKRFDLKTNDKKNIDPAKRTTNKYLFIS